MVCLPLSSAVTLPDPVAPLSVVGLFPGSLLLMALSGLVGVMAAIQLRRDGVARSGLEVERRRLALTRQRLADLERIIPELIIEADRNGTLQFLNDSARNLLDLPEQADDPPTLLSLIAPRDRAEFAQFQAVALQGEMPDSCHLHLLVHAGECLPVRAIAAPILGVGDEQVVGLRAVFTDIRGELAFSQALEQRHTVEAAVTDILRALTMAKDEQWRDALDGAITSLQQLVKLDQCALLRLGDGAAARREFLWSAPDVKDHPQGGVFDLLCELPWLCERLRAGEIIHLEGPDDVPVGATSATADWRRLDVCSLLAVPIFGDGEVMGLMAFVTVTGPANWGPPDVRLLETLGGMVAGTWQRRLARRAQRAASRAAERKLRASEERYRQLNENLEKKIVERTRDLRAANDALRRSEGRYRRIIESLREGYVFYSRDTEGGFTYVSPSFRDVLGYRSLDLITTRFRQWYAQPRNTGARLTAEKNSLGYKQPSYELQVEDARGGDRVLDVLEVPVFDEQGHLISIEGIMHDVTEQLRIRRIVRETQAKLVESEKLAALGSLMAGLSHEINTPIGIGVTASSHLVALNTRCEADYRQGKLTERDFENFLSQSRESADLIQSNLARAGDLMQNFKQVAVDQSAGLERTFNLARFFEDVIQSLSPRLKNTGFRIRRDCPDDLELHCDPGALYQIVSNLVLNSLNHGFDGLLVGEITLQARLADEQVMLEYRDNGNGMSREQVARIYEPFYTTRRGRGGTGLGMHIVYNNVTQTLGGTIQCVSKPGQGTRFTIAIPLPAEVQHG